jgi:hypothetical protein
MYAADEHISNIRQGDTVIHNGEARTVGKNDIKHGTFMKSTLFGDSYSLGTRSVKLVMWEPAS